MRLLVSGMFLLAGFALSANAAITPPRVASDVCLACHDGSAGPDVPVDGSHPVKIQYDNVQRFSSAFLKPSFSPSGRGSTIQADMLLDGNVECTSCHFTHEEETDTESRLKSEDGAVRTLCRACHDPQ